MSLVNDTFRKEQHSRILPYRPPCSVVENNGVFSRSTQGEGASAAIESTLAQLDDDELQAEREAKLVFWIECLDAATAEHTAEKDCFLGRVVQSVTFIDIQLEQGEVWRNLAQVFTLEKRKRTAIRSRGSRCERPQD